MTADAGHGDVGSAVLFGPWPQPVHARIVELGDRELWVSDPLGGEHPLPGIRLTVTWSGPCGLSEVEGRLAAVVEDGPRSWQIDLLGPIRTTQRRRFVRTTVLLTATVHHVDNALALPVGDLSEGGLELVTPAPSPFGPGDELDVVLELHPDRPGGVVVARAEVVRVQTESGRVFAGCRFVDLDERQCNEIRRYVFRREALDRARLRR